MFVLTLGEVFASDMSQNNLYIWQRKWDECVKKSISDIQAYTNRFSVLCGDAKVTDSKAHVNLINVRWEYFNTESEVTAVFRMQSDFSKLLSQNDSFIDVSNKIKDAIKDVVAKAETNNIKVTGIQLDYDCPTSKLNDYAKLAHSIREEFPNYSISITALPTWLNSRGFKRLANEVDFYVLQLYSFETPKNINDKKQIFLKDQALDWIEIADRTGKEFYIGLPTYGYEIIFGEDGRFIGFKAEHEPLVFKERIQSQTVLTTPEEILIFLIQLKEKQFKNIKGTFWFRLPVQTDEYNWDMKTLQSVLAGKIPEYGLKTDLRKNKNGLLELYIINTGERNILAPASVNIMWQGNTPYYDVIGGFRKENSGNGIKITGKAPKVGDQILVAWFRNAERDKEASLKVSEVEYEED